MSEVAQKVPSRQSHYPKATLRPEKCQQTSSGAKRGRLGLGCAQAPSEERQGHGCSHIRAGPGEGTPASSRGKKNGDNLMAVTNEKQVQITERKRKRGTGAAGEVSS